MNFLTLIIACAISFFFIGRPEMAGAKSNHQTEEKVKTSAIAHWPVQLRISKIEKAKDRWIVVVALQFNNTSNREFLLDGPTAAEDGKLENKLFHISCNGKEVPYHGMMAKRAPPSKFIKIAPGARYETTVDLGDFYHFPSEGGEISVTYESLNHFSPDDVVLKSNTVQAQLK